MYIHTRSRKWQPTPELLPGKLHEWRSLVDYSPWGLKELDTTERLHFLSFYNSFWRRKWHPTPVFLPGESHGWRGLVGHSLWGCKESDTTERLNWTETESKNLEKEMATHSSTLAWKIPWMEEPGRLQSMGSQRVGHNWATSLSLSTQEALGHAYIIRMMQGFPWWLSGKKSPANAGTARYSGLIPGPGRSHMPRNN